MTELKLDYDALLDDWAEILHKKADAAKEIEENAETGSFKHAHCIGYREGLFMALSQLSLLEKRKKKKYLIESPPEQLNKTVTKGDEKENIELTEKEIIIINNALSLQFKVVNNGEYNPHTLEEIEEVHQKIFDIMIRK